jgi:hypothetical protein
MRLLEKKLGTSSWHKNSKSASQQVNNRVSNPDKPKEYSKDLVSSGPQADLACPVLLNNSILCYPIGLTETTGNHRWFHPVPD